MFAPFARTRPRARALDPRLWRGATRFAASAWHRWFLDRHADFWLGELGSTWSTTELRARVVAIVDETPDTRSFVLAPNRHWPGHRAGQFVPVEVEIDGVRVRRCYSISSGSSRAGAGKITITVKRVPGGRVSSWLHDHLHVGDVLGLGRPAGDFVVTTAEPLLLVAAGSGITPIIGILRDLEARDALHDIVLIHGARDDAGASFGRELATMTTQLPGLRLIAHRSGIAGRLDALAIARLVPDLADREIYACGPPGLLDVVAQAAVEAGVPDRLHVERFVAPPQRPRPADFVAVAQLRDRRVGLDGAGSLLEQLERAGERPPHGCRIGICNTCRCTKRSGTVEDAVTGAISSEPDQQIRLCTSFARSDLELAL